jgi:uncharacterized membrane protein
MDNWIKKSGQTWKIIIALCMALVSCILFGIVFTSKSFDTFYLSYAAMFFALCMLFFLISIKCPYCKKSVAWFFIKNGPFNSWLSDFIHADKCPICKKKF